jgi:hypothetical protein
MMTFLAASGSACTVKTDATTFDVFPDKVQKDTWSLLSHPEESLVNKKALSWPGEYDFAGITVRAVGQQDGKQVSYLCAEGGIRAAFIDTPVLDWSDAELEKLGDVDVLVVAADNPKKLVPLVEAVDPRIIILIDVKGGDLSGCAKALGQSSVQPVAELKVKPGSLPQDSRQVVVLK